MLSYQHSFHAGNHADVLKHLSLLALLDKLQAKDKAYFYLDTHAGNGCYDLPQAAMAHKYDTVMASMLSNDSSIESSIITQYKNIVAPYLAKNMYPGSPLIADSVARDHDNMHVNELHPKAFDALTMWCKHSSLQIHQRNAFELLNALMPPKPNRGLVLIDPPYEQASEYEQVFTSVASALKKWPQGIFAIWYPLLSNTRLNRHTKEIEENPKSGLSERMLTQFSSIAENGLLDLQFAVQSPSEHVGMYGSGMLIINPPWQLDTQLKLILQVLEEQIKQDDNQLSSLKFLIPLK